MPRLKATRQEEQNNQSTAIIKYGMALQGVNYTDLGRVLGVTDRQVRNKVNDPSILTMRDIRTLIRVLKFNEEEIIKLLGGTK